MARIFSEKTLEFVIPGRPLTAGAPNKQKMLKEQGLHSRQGAKGYKSLIAMIAKTAVVNQGWEMTADKPYYILVTIYLGAGSVHGKAKTEKLFKSGVLPTRRPSCNRILNLITSTLSGIVWTSLQQVVGVLVVKKYSKEEGVEVLVGSPKNWRELNHDLRNA